jgi:hypothetical protein
VYGNHRVHKQGGANVLSTAEAETIILTICSLTDLSVALDTAGEDLSEEEPGHIVDDSKEPTAQNDLLGPAQRADVLITSTWYIKATQNIKPTVS